MMSTIKSTALVLAVGIALFASGCQTTSDPTKPRRGKEPIILYKGMPAEEIVALLGEPLKTKQTEGFLGETETWVYEDFREKISLVQADTREVPYIHPISGVEMTITEAVTKQKVDRITLTTELYIFDGKLIGWKEHTRESTSFED